MAIRNKPHEQAQRNAGRFANRPCVPAQLKLHGISGLEIFYDPRTDCGYSAHPKTFY
jgi:hypothetical protein